MAFRILVFGLMLELIVDNEHYLRMAAAVVSAYAYFARGDTGAQAQTSRLVVDREGMFFNEDAKNLPKIAPATLTTPWPANRKLSPHRLLERYKLAHEAAWRRVGRPAPEALWQLPGDAKLPVASDIGLWLTKLLQVLHRPPGVKWTGHSIRGGAASAALAISVSLPAICRWGIWVALDSVTRYLDPLVPRSREALFFFAHLVRGAE